MRKAASVMIASSLKSTISSVVASVVTLSYNPAPAYPAHVTLRWRAHDVAVCDAQIYIASTGARWRDCAGMVM